MTLANLDVLIVDDHRLTRNLVAEILASLQSRVRMASDAAAAFDEVVRLPPDIVISDLHMPVSGHFLINNIRKSPRSPDPTLPIIAMTSMTNRKTVLGLRDSGANEVICKPFTAKVVLSRIAAVIDIRREFVRASAYVGPCRRRRGQDAPDRPLRRAGDAARAAASASFIDL